MHWTVPMKMPARLQLFGFLLLTSWLLCLAGCGITKSKQDADMVLTRHFQAVSTNDLVAALNDYGSQFFQGTSKEEWRKVLSRLNAKMGAYQSHTITGWRSFTKAGSFGSGTTVTLQCQVIYARHSAKETFTLFKGLTDSGYKIIAHQIDGAALLTE